MNLKRILFINDNGGEYAGSEISLYQTLEALNRKEFEPVVLCYSNGKWAEKVRRLGIPVIMKDLGYYRRSKNPLVLAQQFSGFLKAVRSLKDIIRKEEIVMIHVNKTLSAPVAVLAAKKIGIPCIWHVRSFAKRLGWLARYFVRSCDRILFVSQAAKEPYAIAFPEFHDKFKVLYNRVNLEDGLVEKGQLRKELGVSSQTPLVGMVGHFIPCKKHDDFLMSTQAILRAIPETRFVIVGDTLDINPQEEKSKKDYKSKLHSIFEQYQLAGKVFFLGQRYDIANVFADLDILVVPSQFETFGRVAVEASYYGVPLVAYRGGGLPEIFVDGEIIFINPGDVQALAEGVISLLKFSQKKEDQVKRAREKASKFASDDSIRVLEKIYKELLEVSS